MSIISRKIDGITVGQKRKDGYVNITALSTAHQKATGVRREVSEWLENKRTKESLEHLSLTADLPVVKLVDKREGRNGGTWIHPDLFPNFQQWLKQGRQERTEQEVQAKLFLEVGGNREVLTLAGKIDILTSTQVIEVKRVKKWVHGVGQVLVYGTYYPSHERRIHLFGETQASMITFIEAHCAKLGIVVTWEP